MNRLIENHVVSEIKYGTNFAYILNDNNSFLPTEYKMLHGQMDSVFLKCMKMLFNGKTQLFYLTETYVSMLSILHKLNPDNFLSIVSNLFASIIEAKNHGFLSCKHIDISFEHIFIDPATLKVKLVYIPATMNLYDDVSSFESEIRINLIKNNIDSSRNISSSSSSQPKQFKLIAMDIQPRVEIVVDKPEFVIGKKQSVVDGVVSFNKLISRVHCKIVLKQQQYYIEDLKSANGTYVNNVRLQPNVPTRIKHGDIVRMANSNFQVVIA